jgi:rhodanese-related sulfurtransferase
MRLPTLILICWFIPFTSSAETDPVLEAIQEFMEFAAYSEGAISPDQLMGLGLSTFIIVDTRQSKQFSSEHLPGAVNIEWREVIARRAEIPKDRPVVLYCDTGLLSSKAHFALRLLGYENVKVLYGGINNWRVYVGLDAARH